ncbi:MAG TPA: phosphatidylglycerophosphatase A [Phycisphaerae bacterium]|nr:phosphatidylglycerophosphatase A [Phycisphaerae bacterium]
MNGRRGDTLKLAGITVLGSGYLRPAPATCASALVTLLWAALWWLLNHVSAARWPIECVTAVGILIACWLSIRWGEWAIAHFGKKDPSPFVLDEFAGMWVALLGLPLIAGGDLPTFAWVVGGQFVLFRIMDIAKPPPVYQIQRLPAGWGILADDLIAGVFANLLGQLIWRLTPAATWLAIDQATT